MNDHNFGRPDLSTMESLTWNRYMLSRNFKKSEMKQIECGFWEEVRYHYVNYYFDSDI